MAVIKFQCLWWLYILKPDSHPRSSLLIVDPVVGRHAWTRLKNKINDDADVSCCDDKGGWKNNDDYDRGGCAPCLMSLLAKVSHKPQPPSSHSQSSSSPSSFNCNAIFISNSKLNPKHSNASLVGNKSGKHKCAEYFQQHEEWAPVSDVGVQQTKHQFGQLFETFRGSVKFPLWADVTTIYSATFLFYRTRVRSLGSLVTL